MNTVRSSGWKTDAIVVVPESVLLSFTILLLLQKFKYTGNALFLAALPAICAYSFLMAFSAYLAAKKNSEQEDIHKEAEKMSALGIPDSIIAQAAADAAVDARQWKKMVQTNIGSDRFIASPPSIVFFRTIFFAVLAGTILLLPFLFIGREASGWDLSFMALIIMLAGVLKYAFTARRPLAAGALRMLMQALILYGLVEIIYILVNAK